MTPREQAYREFLQACDDELERCERRRAAIQTERFLDAVMLLVLALGFAGFCFATCW